MGDQRYLKGIALASIITVTLSITFILSPRTVYGQDVSLIDPTPSEAITQSPETTETIVPTNVPEDAAIIDSMSISEGFTWTYSIEFPQTLTTSAEDLVTGLDQIGITGELISSNKVQLSGKSDLDKLRETLYHDPGQAFGIIRGASKIQLKMPVTELNTLSLVIESDISTGYSWMVASASVAGTTMQSASTFKSRASGVVTQQQVLTFTPTTTGNAEIILLYRRPFNKAETSSRVLNLDFSSQQLSLDLSDPTPDLSGALSSQLDSANSDIVNSQEITATATLPSSWDWRSFGVLTPIKDQGNYGTCWAFSQNGTVEANILANGGPSLDLSEQFLVTCNKQGWNANSGGYPIHQYYKDFIALSQTEAGAVLESIMSYDPAKWADKECPVISNHDTKISNWSYFTYDTADTATIKNIIYTHGPISAGVCAGSKFLGYSSGYFSDDERKDLNDFCYDKKTNTYGINHYIDLVGWKDVSDTEGYWILRNSWGTGWGMSGYMYIKYGTSNVGLWGSWVDYTAVNSPTTVTPATTIDTINPKYTWNSVNGATAYEVQVLQNSGIVLIDNTFDTSVCTSNTCASLLSKSLSNGDFYWRVKAKVNGAWGTYTRPKAFSVDSKIPNPPVTITPSGNQTTYNLTFTWKPSPLATTYDFRISSNLTNRVIFSDTINATTNCTNDLCSYKPTVSYGPNIYYYTVAAKNEYGTSAATLPRKFSFCNPSGVNSQFNNNSSCWDPHAGGKWIPGSTFYYNAGAANYWASSTYPVNMSNFSFEARIKRNSSSGIYESGLVFRGAVAYNSVYRWNNGYFFTYKNDGKFRVYKMVNGTEKVLKTWTASSAIKKNDWNVLKVVTSGTSISCYINGTLVWKGSDSQFASGRQGFAFYNGGTGLTFFADYAILTKK